MAYEFIPDSVSPGGRSLLSNVVGSGAPHLKTPFKSNVQRMQGVLSAARGSGPKKPDTAPRVGAPIAASPNAGALSLRNDILKNDPGIRREMTRQIREELRQQRPEVQRAQKFNKAKRRFHQLTQSMSPDAARKQIMEEFGEIPRSSS